MTATETMEVGGKLIHLLTQQKLLYRQLQELAEKQTKLVDGSDPEMLLKVLALRQRLIDRLGAVDRELQPIRADWARIAPGLSEAQRHQAQQLIEGVQQILSEILDRDEKDSQTLNNSKQTVAVQIRNAASGKRMNQAYSQNATPSQSRFLDTKSE